MIEVLKEKYWSKSQAFLLPLTTIQKNHIYDMKTYLFWKEYSIHNYQLILKFQYNDNYDDFVNYCKRVIFPQLDKKGTLIESYDFDGETVFILDLSQWAPDIELFIRGKYSKMSKEAKKDIVEYHTYYDRGAKIMIEIVAALEPSDKLELLGKMTPIEYVAENYGLNLQDLRKVGELGSIYDEYEETLLIDDD